MVCLCCGLDYRKFGEWRYTNNRKLIPQNLLFALLLEHNYDQDHTYLRMKSDEQHLGGSHVTNPGLTNPCPNIRCGLYKFEACNKYQFENYGPTTARQCRPTHLWQMTEEDQDAPTTCSRYGMAVEGCTNALVATRF